MPDPHGQEAYPIRFEWGPTGAGVVAEGADVMVVVDVLSFTTTVCVALERGITVLPFGWRDERARAYADAHDAVLAIGRFEARDVGQTTVSLSPAEMASARDVDRVVLPSPNGSAISFGLAERDRVVIAASLRNRAAVGHWLAARVAAGDVVAVVAAGERWPDGSLRPAVEDLWGAGAVLSTLLDHDVEDLSPEARAAADAFRAVEDGLPAAMAACAGGVELSAVGFADDVAVAAQVDVSIVVPRLVDGEFRT